MLCVGRRGSENPPPPPPPPPPIAPASTSSPLLMEEVSTRWLCGGETGYPPPCATVYFLGRGRLRWCACVTTTIEGHQSKNKYTGSIALFFFFKSLQGFCCTKKKDGDRGGGVSSWHLHKNLDREWG